MYFGSVQAMTLLNKRFHVANDSCIGYDELKLETDACMSSTHTHTLLNLTPVHLYTRIPPWQR